MSLCSRTARKAARSEAPVVQVQDEDRRIRSGSVDFFQRWHAALGELELCPASDHSDPLGSRRPPRLLLQHAEGVASEGPIRFESGNDGASPAVDDSCCRPA